MHLRFLFLLLLTGLLTGPARGQQLPALAPDVIITRNGEEIAARVEEVAPDLIKFYRADNPQGPRFSIMKNDVFMIRYGNGTRDVFAVPRSATGVPPPAPPKARAAADSVFEPVRSAGPRVGFTTIGAGTMRQQLRDKYNASHVISQLGWQFEQRIFALPSGLNALVEFVPLVGGLEQGLFLPSISGVLGLRERHGLEVGVGPNLTLVGPGLVLAAGATIPGKYLSIPINVAFTPGQHQSNRFSFLIGYTYRRR